MTGLWLLVGASVTASSFFWQPPSPGQILAERLGAPYEIHAHAGRKLHEVMPTDAEIRAAAMVVSVDGFYWYSDRKDDCEVAHATAERLFAVRAGRPMILATVPGPHCVNAYLRERCVGKCILVEPEPFDGLHPDRGYMDRAAQWIMDAINGGGK